MKHKKGEEGLKISFWIDFLDDGRYTFITHTTQNIFRMASYHKNENLNIRGSVVKKLAGIGSQIKQVVPKLIQLLEEDDIFTRVNVIRALELIEGEGNQVVQVLTQLVKNYSGGFKLRLKQIIKFKLPSPLILISNLSDIR